MSKNFVSYGDAETIFEEYADGIKDAQPNIFTVEEWQSLTTEERAEYDGKIINISNDSISDDSLWIDISSDASSYIDSGTIKYKKIGHLVIVKMWAVLFKANGSGDTLSTNLPTCDDSVTNRIFRDQQEGLGAIYMNTNSKTLFCHHANPSGDATQANWYGEMVYTTSD